MSSNHFSDEVEKEFADMTPFEKKEILKKQQSIQLYKDLMINSLKELTFYERGILISLILSQYANDSLNEAETDDAPIEKATRIVKLAYRNIGENIAKDNERYIKVVIKNRLNGNKGGRPKKGQ